MPVSTSEKTYGQRLQKGRDKVTYISTLAGYSPPNPDIQTANMTPFLDSIDAQNGLVAAKNQALSEARNLRSNGYYGPGGLKKTMPKVRSFLASFTEGKKSTAFKAVQKFVQKINGYVKPKKLKTGSNPPTEEEQKKISQIEKSFGSMLQNGKDIVQIATSLGAAYTPSNPAINVPSMTAMMTLLGNLNASVIGTQKEADDAIRDRFDLYEDDNGLRERMQAINEYVASIYDKDSQEYLGCVAIKY